MDYSYIDWQDIRAELPAYGFKPVEERDRVMVRSCIDTVISKLKSFTNCPVLPEKLKPEAIKMVCGEFLYRKKVTGQLTVEGENGTGISFPHRVTQWSEGDTSVSFTAAGKNDEANFDAYIDKLRRGDPWVLEHFRQLDWR